MPKVRESEDKEVAAVVSDKSVDKDHVYALANPPSPAMEISVDTDEVSMLDNASGGEIQFSQPKKAKLSDHLKMSDQVSNVSPDLHHIIPL